MKQKSKVGLTMATIYLLLVLAALLFTLYALKKTAFAGVYLGLLTLPWSILLAILLDSLHIQDSVPIITKLGILLLAALLNASILYCIGVRPGKPKSETGAKRT